MITINTKQLRVIEGKIATINGHAIINGEDTHVSEVKLAQWIETGVHVMPVGGPEFLVDADGVVTV